MSREHRHKRSSVAEFAKNSDIGENVSWPLENVDTTFRRGPSELHESIPEASEFFANSATQSLADALAARRKSTTKDDCTLYSPTPYRVQFEKTKYYIFPARLTRLLSLILILPFATLHSEEPPLHPTKTTTPLVLTEGGTADKPAVFDGQGMVIDLGIDVSKHEWKQEGDLWTSQPGLLSEHGQEPRIAGQTAGLFVDEIPITIPRDLETEKSHPDRKSRCYFPPDQLQPGQMGYADDGSLYFRWPKGAPKTKVIILPPKEGTNCVSIACSHIIVRNLTAKHAGNDGFNIHGDRKGVRLENVRAFSNADEGISAHEATEMEVIGAEIAWNGSAAGGVADVDNSITSYRDCVVHDNAGAAFYLAGKKHRVTDTLIYNEEKDFAVQKGTEFTQSEIRSQ